MKTLLLWDIDGTLIVSGGAGMRALEAALSQVFGIRGSLADIDFAGRTDGWIVRKVFAKYGLEPTEQNIARYLDGYIGSLPRELANPNARVLPGVAAILQAAAARGDIAQGLLTGNVRRAAEVKLGYHGLWQHFAFGAFADDAELRNELGSHAVRRACAHHGVDFAATRIWIIGDTAHDIACGNAIGARTLAVGTGGHDLGELRQHNPTAVLADLSDTAQVLRLFDIA